MAINRIKTRTDHELYDHYQRIKLQENTREDHKLVIDGLTHIFWEEHLEEPDMNLYGSIVSGFATDDCDIDVSVHFSNDAWNKPRCLRDLDHLLGTGVDIYEKKFIPAKIPIIEFIYTGDSREYKVDLSMDNDLAVANSQLLKKYSEIDPVVPIIGVLVKEWAKKNGICGHQMPNSYTWIIMVIHYLQKVGVLPYLQEIGPKVPMMIGGKNVYFFKDLLRLGRYFVSDNYQSLTDLLIGFFGFYTQFDFDEPISIRNANGTRRNFNGKIHVRDPFIGPKNLTGTLTRQQNDRIQGEITDGYHVLVTKSRRNRNAGQEILSYLSEKVANNL